MPHRHAGFTLIELLIVVAIIAAIASMAIPNLLSAQLNTNEAAAISTLKNIAAAQSQFRSGASIDVNNNGQGEYGYLAELAGGIGLRSDEAGSISSHRADPAMLSRAFGRLSSSLVQRSGYVFALMLPSAPNLWTREAPAGGSIGRSIAAGFAEKHWACYAWPTSWGKSGRRAFYVNESGDVLGCKNIVQRYSGANKIVEGYAAVHHQVSPPGSMASTVAANASGLDGEFWTVVR